MYVVNVDGTHRRLLAAGVDPKWSPDGRCISFTSDGAIELVHPDGTALHALAR